MGLEGGVGAWMSGVGYTWLGLILSLPVVQKFPCTPLHAQLSCEEQSSFSLYLDLWNSHSKLCLCLDTYLLQLTAGRIAIQSPIAHQLKSHVSTSRLSALCMSMWLAALINKLGLYHAMPRKRQSPLQFYTKFGDLCTTCCTQWQGSN